LALLFNFKKGLIKRHNLLVILLSKILDHRYSLTSLSLFKAARFRTHVPSDGTYFVSFVMTVTRHNNSMFEFIVNGFLDLLRLWSFTSESCSFHGKPIHLFVYEFKTVVD